MSMEMWSDSHMGYFGKQQFCVKPSTEINCNNRGSSVAADSTVKQQTQNDNKANVPEKMCYRVLLGKSSERSVYK